MNEFDVSDEMNEEEEDFEQNDNIWEINFIEEKNFWDKIFIR